MATLKRRVFKFLKWMAIVAGLGSTAVGLLLGYNAAQLLQVIPTLNIQFALSPIAPKTLYYGGFGYDFNFVGYYQAAFPNGTVIDSNTDYILWPYELTLPLKSTDPMRILLGLYANTFFLDVNLYIPWEAIQWAKDNGQPLYLTAVFIIWFNLPIAGFNLIMTPTTLFYSSPQYVP
ncbi:MAG: hypothetical protein QXR19_08940 [Candidatus Jordarchaeaceae archaeon]